MKDKNHLLVDTDTEVLTNLPSGKISNNGIRVPIKAQKSISCLLYSLRRLAFFHDPDVKHTKLYKAFRHIKNALVHFNGNYDDLLTCLIELCIQLNINAERVIATSKSYPEVMKNNKKIQTSLLYEALIKQRLFSLFNVQESGWHPKDGFAGLKESLKKHGAHVFIGKFGAWCHAGQDKLVNFNHENTHNREVYAFKKGSYAGELTNWTHAIIVDQVKNVNGVDMVFFRDPYDHSDDSKNEKVYALSYESFVQRLTNQQSQRYAQNDCPHENNFGIVSSNPRNLLKK